MHIRWALWFKVFHKATVKMWAEIADSSEASVGEKVQFQAPSCGYWIQFLECCWKDHLGFSLAVGQSLLTIPCHMCLSLGQLMRGILSRQSEPERGGRGGGDW